jgi:hypothetical protein
VSGYYYHYSSTVICMLATWVGIGVLLALWVQLDSTWRSASDGFGGRISSWKKEAE